MADPDDDRPLRPDDPLALLLREDLARHSRAELTARIAALEGEIARARAALDGASAQRAAAEALFGRG